MFRARLGHSISGSRSLRKGDGKKKQSVASFALPGIQGGGECANENEKKKNIGRKESRCKVQVCVNECMDVCVCLLAC